MVRLKGKQVSLSISAALVRNGAAVDAMFRSGTGRDDLEYHRVLESPVFRD